MKSAPKCGGGERARGGRMPPAIDARLDFGRCGTGANVDARAHAADAIGQNRKMEDYLESVRRAGGEPVEVLVGGEAPEQILAASTAWY